MISKQNDLINKFGSVHQNHQNNKRQIRKRKKNYGDFNKWEHNKSYNTNEIRRTHSNRKRSKSEDIRVNDPMDFWEWNGTEWINTKANHFEQMRKVVRSN